MFARVCIFAALCVVLVTFPAHAQKRSARSSADDLTQSVEDFYSSVGKLQENNRKLSQQNGALKARIAQGRRSLDNLNQDHERLTNDLRSYVSQTQSKSQELLTFENQANEIKRRYQEVEKEIALQSTELERRQERQNFLTTQILTLEDPAQVAVLQEQNAQALSQLQEKKTQLSQRLENSRLRIEDVQAETSKQEMLRNGSQEFMARLEKQRNLLQKKLASLSPETKKPIDIKELNNIRQEVADLTKARNEQFNLAQMLRSQYDTNNSTKAAIQEKKLQDKLIILNNENKILKEKNVSLKLEMVNLDKRKSKLEQIVSQNRRPTLTQP